MHGGVAPRAPGRDKAVVAPALLLRILITYFSKTYAPPEGAFRIAPH